MSITKTNFYSQELNAFTPNRVRGELLDWGLNAMTVEVQIDASEADTLYAGDLVKIKEQYIYVQNDIILAFMG